MPGGHPTYGTAAFGQPEPDRRRRRSWHMFAVGAVAVLGLTLTVVMVLATPTAPAPPPHGALDVAVMPEVPVVPVQSAVPVQNPDEGMLVDLYSKMTNVARGVFGMGADQLAEETLAHDRKAGLQSQLALVLGKLEQAKIQQEEIKLGQMMQKARAAATPRPPAKAPERAVEKKTPPHHAKPALRNGPHKPHGHKPHGHKPKPHGHKRGPHHDHKRGPPHGHKRGHHAHKGKHPAKPEHHAHEGKHPAPKRPVPVHHAHEGKHPAKPEHQAHKGKHPAKPVHHAHEGKHPAPKHPAKPVHHAHEGKHERKDPDVWVDRHGKKHRLHPKKKPHGPHHEKHVDHSVNLDAFKDKLKHPEHHSHDHDHDHFAHKKPEHQAHKGKHPAKPEHHAHKGKHPKHQAKHPKHPAAKHPAAKHPAAKHPAAKHPAELHSKKKQWYPAYYKRNTCSAVDKSSGWKRCLCCQDQHFFYKNPGKKLRQFQKPKAKIDWAPLEDMKLPPGTIHM